MLPFNWNANRQGDKIEFYVGYVNYMDANDIWKPIDCIIQDVGTHFEVTEAPFTCRMPKTAGGTAEFISNNRYDIFKKEKITADPFTMEMKALDIDENVVGELYDINGDGRLDAVIYPNAYPDINADLIYYVKHGIAPRLEKLIKFNSALTEDFEPQFWLKYDKQTEVSPRDFVNHPKFQGIENRRSARDHARGLINSPQALDHKDGFYVRAWNEPQKRGVGIKTPSIWDSGDILNLEQKKKEVEMSISRFGPIPNNEYILEKTIPSSFFIGAILPCYSDAVFTFNPDPFPAITACDGYLLRNSSSFNAAHIALTGIPVNGDSNDVVDAARITSNSFTIRRAFDLYDLSSLTGTIDSAKLRKNISTIYDDIDDANSEIVSVESFPASNTILVSGDYDACGDAVTNPTEFTDRVDISSLLLDTYVDMPLNAAGITYLEGVGTGIAKFGTREVHDAINSNPFTINGQRTGIRYKSADAILIPILEITTVPNSITVGVATAVDGGNHDIDVSMHYTNDDNNDSTYTVDYKLSASGIWINHVTGAANTPSPFETNIPNLIAGETYDVRCTYVDPDGVTGTNPQIITDIPIALFDSLTAGEATAEDGGDHNIIVIMPYTDDGNNNSTYKVEFKLSTELTWTNHVSDAPNTPSPFITSITGLAGGLSYDVRVTYNDPDGVTGDNPQIISGIPIPFTLIDKKITDHNQAAKNRLLEQYKGKAGIEGLIEAYYGNQIQDLEDVLFLFFDRLNIELSEGVQLDGIGELIGQDRIGLTDILYRLFIRARIGANVSEGDIERIIEVWQLITQANIVKLEETFPAELNLATDVALPEELIDIAFALIQKVSGAGIGVGITTFLPEDAFAFDGADPLITKGFGNLISQGTTTGTTAFKLVDSGATFLTDGVDIGMIAMNDTDGTQANVVSVDSDEEITLDADKFTAGEDYYINAATGGKLAKIQGGA